MLNLKPIVTLVCCCCGQDTKGRQWFNQDRGYGVCHECGAEHYATDTSAVGKRGVHWDIGAPLSSVGHVSAVSY